ncbi:MAG TPA: tetratricopeptide repeat protein [Polyangiaceae bacterium]|jgi:tetratricopeptide (TPR) repeat protein
MRYAVVVAPPRFLLPAEGSVFTAPEPIGPVCAAWIRGGRRLMLVQSTPDLVDDLSRALAEVGGGDDLVIYLAAFTTTAGERVTLKVADGERESTIDLRALPAAVKERNPAAVVYVVEAHHDGDADDPMLAAEHVDGILRGLEARTLGHGAAVGVLPVSSAAAGEWPFTHYVLAALADPVSRNEWGATTMSLAFDRMRAGGAVDARAQSFTFVRAGADFAILDAAPPPADASGPRAPALSKVDDTELDWNTEEAPPPRPSHVEVPVSVGELPASRDSHIEVPISVGELAPRATDGERTVDRERTSEPVISGLVETPRVPSEVSANAFADAPHSTQALQEPERTPSADAMPAPDTSRVSPPPITTATITTATEEPRPTEPSLPGAPVPAAAAEDGDLPPFRDSAPSLPALEPLLDLADDAFERGSLPEALAGYKAALMVAPAGDAARRANVYARIGDVKRTQGKTREAARYLEKASRSDPTHKGALDGLISLATDAKDMKRVIELRRRRLGMLSAPEERVDELRAIADVLASHLDDPRGASETLDQALSMAQKSRAALLGLRTAYEKLRRWPRVAEVLVSLADLAETQKEKAAFRTAAAEIAIERMREQERGTALLGQALDDDPTLDKAQRVLVAGHTARGEWKEIEGLYLHLAERLTAQGDMERTWDTWRKLGVLRRDKLHNSEGALEAFSNAVRCRPDNADSRALLAEMYLATGEEAQAIVQFERIALNAPTRASTFTRLFGLHRRAARTDRAWLAGAALVELGAADMDQQLFVDQYRPDGPIRPARSLDDAAWDDLMRAPGADDVVSDVLRAVVLAAVSIRVDDLRQARQLVSLDPSRRQSATSTVSVVRSFYWAAQVLGVDPPDLFTMDDVPGGVAAVQAPAPTTALGPDVLRGLTTKDLAFVAGRHLTYFRPEHYCLVFYPTLSDLSALFLGAVTLVLPNLTPPAPLRDAVARIRKLLGKELGGEEKRKLSTAVERLEARDGRVDLTAWIRGVELSAQRAGLLLCGDLAVGTARLRAEADSRAIGELTFEDKRGDLLAFVASEKLSRARALLGVDARISSVGATPAGQLQAG